MARNNNAEEKNEAVKNEETNNVQYVPTEQELSLQEKVKELEEKLAAANTANEETQKALSRMNELENTLAELKASTTAVRPKVNAIGNMVLICNSRVRTFTVQPEKVIKIYKGTKQGLILKDNVLTITPGSIIEVTPDLAEFLLSFKKDFSRYDVPLV